MYNLTAVVKRGRVTVFKDCDPIFISGINRTSRFFIQGTDLYHGCRYQRTQKLYSAESADEAQAVLRVLHDGLCQRFSLLPVLVVVCTILLVCLFVYTHRL